MYLKQQKLVTSAARPSLQCKLAKQTQDASSIIPDDFRDT